MMKSQFSLGSLWMLCLVMSLLIGTNAMAAQHDKEIERFARAYRAARTAIERRAVCLDAIDAGVVAQGRSVAVVDATFGTHYAKNLPSGSELETGVVHFQRQPRSPRNDIQVPYVGWYLAVEFDSGGNLQNYYLSNLHK